MMQRLEIFLRIQVYHIKLATFIWKTLGSEKVRLFIILFIILRSYNFEIRVDSVRSQHIRSALVFALADTNKVPWSKTLNNHRKPVDLSYLNSIRTTPWFDDWFSSYTIAASIENVCMLNKSFITMNRTSSSVSNLGPHEIMMTLGPERIDSGVQCWNPLGTTK